MPLIRDWIYIMAGQFFDVAPSRIYYPINAHSSLWPVVGLVLLGWLRPLFILLVIVALRPHLRVSWWHRVAAPFGRLARQRGAAVVLTGLLSFVLCVGFGLLARPEPVLHDEFSYLLGADTFAHGRLTNPTHPLWQHFETFHVLQRPTYTSKYPPAQALCLALGQVLTGHPIAGVWLSTAFACAALCWMLQAWLPPRWALLGGLLAALHPLVLEWSQSFWGGAAAMAGGALLWGSLGRIILPPRRLAPPASSLPPRLQPLPRARDGLICGLAIAILLNSRPYEGAVMTALALLLLLHWLLTQHRPLAAAPRRIMLALGVTLLLTVAAMGYYNKVVTGDALQMPYQVYEATYSINPLLYWQHNRPVPVYYHQVIRDFYVEQAKPLLDRQLHFSAELDYWGWHLMYCVAAYCQLLALNLGLLGVAAAVGRDRALRLVALLFIPLTVASLLANWLQPHYVSASMPLYLLLSLQGLRHLREFRWRGRPWGRVMVRLCLLCLPFSLLSLGIRLGDIHSHRLIYDCVRDRMFGRKRARLLAQLAKVPGPQLVIVRYKPEHIFAEEWVYNAAGIDHARVVWAREMDGPHNRRLLRYFRDRRAWLLQADAPQPRLIHYQSSAGDH